MAGAPLVTRDGRPAKLIAHLPECEAGHRVIAIVDKHPHHYSEGGQMWKDRISDEDLLLAQVKKSTYVFLYIPKKGTDVYSDKAKTEEVAREWCSSMRHKFVTGTILTWEEDAE